MRFLKVPCSQPRRNFGQVVWPCDFKSFEVETGTGGWWDHVNDVEELVEDHQENSAQKSLWSCKVSRWRPYRTSFSQRKRRVGRKLLVFKDNCSKWNEVQECIEKHHPDKVMANRQLAFWMTMPFPTRKKKRKISLYWFFCTKKSEKEPPKYL